MSLRPVLLSTTLIASLPLAGYADVTPEDVWADQVAAIEAMGMTIDAREARSGDTLRISDVVMSSSMDMGMIESLITIRIPAIDIAEAGGGEVDMSLEGAIVYEVATPDVEEIDMSGFTSITTAQFDGKIRVSGNPDDMVYTFDNAAASMTTDEVVIEEMTVQPAVDVAIAPISGQYTSRRSADKHEIDYAFEAGEVAYMVQPSSYGEQSVTLDATINDLTSSASMTLDRSETPTDMMTALLIGGALTAQQDFAGSTFAFEMVDGETGAETQARGQTGAAKTSMTMSNGVIGYDVSASGLSVSISGSQIPFPTIDLAMARTGVSFQAPMVGTGDMQPFGFGLELAELVLPDMVWMMVDPAGQMAHDPATIRLSVNGEVASETGLLDLDPMTFEEGDVPPVRLGDIALPDLFVSALGASIEGNGAGRFADEDMSEEGDLPPFAGKINLTLTGVTALIDKLTSMGMLPPEQAMGAQMMLGMLARPGANANELVSEIEMTEDGQILANGVPLPF